jgi:hypothetical protein
MKKDIVRTMKIVGSDDNNRTRMKRSMTRLLWGQDLTPV